MKKNNMTKKEIIEAMGIHDANEITALLKLTKAELELKYADTFVDYTVENIETTEEENVMNKNDGFEIIAAQVAAFEKKAIVAEAPKATVTIKATQYVRLFPDGVKVCQKRGLAVKKLEKDWKAFSDFVNSQATKLLNDAWKERNGKFTVLYKAMVIDSKNSKKWWALVTAKNTTNKKQCTCLFEGTEAKRELTGNIEYLKF